MIPSTKKDWQWSVYEYHRTWIGENAPERAFANGIANAIANGRNHIDRHQALTQAAKSFSVLRNIPSHEKTRAAIFELVLGANEPNSHGDHFMTICRLVNDATDVMIQNERRNVRLISAMSKFLMLRFPEHSFVYDKNAKIALAHARGLGDGALNDFGLFYDAWKRCPLLMINSIAGAGIDGIDPAGAARIVDKFLWLRGRKNPDDPIPDVPDNLLGCAIAQGTAVWNALANAEPPLTA